MEQFNDILLERHGAVAVLTINRPKVLNALRMQTKEELFAALQALAADPEGRGVIITGTGRAFVAGSDIAEISVNRPGTETAAMSQKAHQLMNYIEAMPKPVMCAINGYALGGGMELALACDLRFISATAKMGVPEIDLGVAPCYGGTQRLPRQIGAVLAKELLFTGRKLTAQESLELHLVNRVCEPEQLLHEAIAFMQDIASKAPVAVRYCKECVNSGLEMSLQDGLRLESEIAGALAETEDAREGVQAFLEKRKPVFTGR